MATIGCTDAACRREAGNDRDEYCNRAADDVRERLHVAERDAHVYGVEANEGGCENESNGDARCRELHDIEQEPFKSGMPIVFR